MGARFWRLPRSAGRGWLLWSALVLLVLVPTVCVLWLSAAASRNARLATRQTLSEAYQGHLALARRRLASALEDRLAALVAPATESPAATFARLVRSGVAPSVVVYDAEGRVAYPDLGATDGLPDAPSVAWRDAELLEYQKHDPAGAADAYAAIAEAASEANEAARARMAQARCLVRAGRRDDALAVLVDLLQQEAYRQAVDRLGRLIVADAALRLLELDGNSPDGQRQAIAEQLATRLDDYDGVTMPSAQRRHVMHRLAAVAPEAARFATLEAEQLAARFVESQTARGEPASLAPTTLPDVWQLVSADGRVAALFETASLDAMLRGTADDAMPSGGRLALVPPEEEPPVSEGVFTAPAGEWLPGWRLALSIPDAGAFVSAARAETTTYLWTGILVVVATSMLAVLLGGVLHAQVRAARLRNDLVATVSHELKTPLASMRVLVDTLLDAERLDTPPAREYLELVAKENLRLSHLIDNFLTFSRMERGRHAFEPAPVAPAEIVADAAAAVRERLDRPGCRLTVDVADGLPRVSADRDAMVTVLVNLLDNALKYTRDEKRITLGVFARDGTICFEVSDNGIGLSRHAARRVFRRFYQVDRRLARETGGCGLGLSIVKFIVADHGGTVRVASRPGRGSTFTVTLPIEKDT